MSWFYHHMVAEYKKESSDQLVLTAREIRKYVIGRGKQAFVRSAGLIHAVAKTELMKELNRAPEGTKFRVTSETFSQGPHWVYSVLIVEGLAFDPDNWRGNLQHALPKELLAILNGPDGHAVAKEAGL